MYRPMRFHIRHIEVLADWTFFAAFLFVIVGLANYLLAALHGTWPAVTRWSVTTAMALLYLAALIIHESAHVVAARLQNRRVTCVRLAFLGGIAEIHTNQDGPRAEFLTALAGPVASLAVGALFVFLAGLAGPASAAWTEAVFMTEMDVGVTLLGWFALVNVTLGMLNLVPAFPLDGGVMLRATLWRWTNQWQKSTKWTAAVALVLGWAAIVGGIGIVFSTDFPRIGWGVVPGLMLMLSGGLVVSIAKNVYGTARVQEIIASGGSAGLLPMDLPTIPASMTLGVLARASADQFETQDFAVLDEGHVVGVVSYREEKAFGRATPSEEQNLSA